MSEYTLEATEEKIEQSSNGMKDNRVQLVISDPRKVEAWELVALESGMVTNWQYVFARYLCRGEKPISPEISGKPIDELTKAELAQIKNSEAFKIISRFPIAELKKAVKSFEEQATAGF